MGKKVEKVDVTAEIIREDLKSIRFYYSKKEQFDEFSKVVGPNPIVEVAIKYNEIAKSAHPRIYHLYCSLYIENKTQEALAHELGFEVQHVQRLHRHLMIHLQEGLADG